jgi:hypothetical protein
MDYFDGILIGKDLPRSLVAHEQAHAFGIVLADLVLQGRGISEVLTLILHDGPLDLYEARCSALRLLNEGR